MLRGGLILRVGLYWVGRVYAERWAYTEGGQGFIYILTSLKEHQLV